MNWLRNLVVVVVLLAACAIPTGPEPLPADRFGAVTALINGRALTSGYYPDSIVANYDVPTGLLHVVGQYPAGSSMLAFQFTISGLGAGSYHIDDGDDPGFAQWMEPGPAPRFRGAGRDFRSFISSGASPDSLTLEQLDLAARTIRGRFSFTALEYRGPGRVVVRGRFSGRILVSPGGQ